jgi:hypothetical protein
VASSEGEERGGEFLRGSRGPGWVVELLEHAQSALGVAPGRHRVRRVPEELEPRLPLTSAVSEALRPPNGLFEHVRLPLELAQRGQRGADDVEELDARRVVLCHQLKCAREQPDGGAKIRALKGAPAGSTEACDGAFRQLCDRARIGAELEPIPASPLQVVTDNLLELDGAEARSVLEPVRKALVQLGAQRLWEPSVRSVVDEGVLEAEGLPAWKHGAVGLHEHLA